MVDWQRAQAPIAGGQRIAERLAAIEKKLEMIEKVLQIKAGGTQVTIKSPASLTIEAEAVLDLTGAMVRLNKGNRPVARQGDVAIGAPAPGAPAIIQAGSPTVMA